MSETGGGKHIFTELLGTVIDPGFLLESGQEALGDLTGIGKGKGKGKKGHSEAKSHPAKPAGAHH